MRDPDRPSNALIDRSTESGQPNPVSSPRACLRLGLLTGYFRSADRGYRRDRPTEDGCVAQPGTVARSAAGARAKGGMSGGRIGAPPVTAVLPDGRCRHFQHGPIDLVLEALGERSEVEAAYDQAWGRFQIVLDELVAELPTLRTPVGEGRVRVTGTVLRGAGRTVRPARLADAAVEHSYFLINGFGERHFGSPILLGRRTVGISVV
jgi:hypothetical protein